jgi:hypothetical protein
LEMACSSSAGSPETCGAVYSSSVLTETREAATSSAV